MTEQELREICTEHLQSLHDRGKIMNFFIQCNELNNPPGIQGIIWNIFVSLDGTDQISIYRIKFESEESLNIENICNCPYFEELSIKLRNEKIDLILK